MSLQPPIFPSSVDPRLAEYIRRQAESISKLENDVQTLLSHPLISPSPSISTQVIIQETSIKDDNPTQIVGIGQASQPQFTYAPIVKKLPKPKSPLAQNGQIVFLESPSNFFTQYTFDGRTSPGSWRNSPNLSPSLLNVNITPVSVNANVTTDQVLMTFLIPANSINVINKTLNLICYGNLDELNGPTIVFKVVLVNGATTTTLLSWTPNTPGVTKTGLPWRIYSTLITQATGVTGAIEVHGELSSDPSAVAGSIGQPILDLNVAPVVVDLTLDQTLKILISFSTGSASNVGRQRMMTLQLLN